jgi:Lrp/AsnC family transcriptional regulator for asnA, asnC and gidA
MIDGEQSQPDRPLPGRSPKRRRKGGEPVKPKVDALDKQLIGVFSEDGRTALAEAAERAGVSTPTVRSRLRNLVDHGVIRIAGLIDPFRVKGLTVALVGLTLDKYKLAEKLEQIAGLDEVSWAAVVTGRYDIVAEVVTAEGMAGFYDFLNVSLQNVGGIRSSEMFVVMKASNKWVLPPRSITRKWAASPEAEE